MKRIWRCREEDTALPQLSLPSQHLCGCSSMPTAFSVEVSASTRYNWSLLLQPCLLVEVEKARLLCHGGVP